MSRTIELPDGTPHTFTDEELERGEAMMARLREVEAARRITDGKVDE